MRPLITLQQQFSNEQSMDFVLVMNKSVVIKHVFRLFDITSTVFIIVSGNFLFNGYGILIIYLVCNRHELVFNFISSQTKTH